MDEEWRELDDTVMASEKSEPLGEEAKELARRSKKSSSLSLSLSNNDPSGGVARIRAREERRAWSGEGLLSPSGNH